MKYINTLAIFLIAVLVISCTEDTVDIDRKGSISGTIKDNVTGDPLEGVVVSTSPVSSNATTDSNGTFLLENILIDDYSVQAALEGYVTGFEPVTVLENETSDVIIELVPRDTENEPPLAPVLFSPEDNEMDVSANVQFVWYASDNDTDEIEYTLEVRNGNTNEILIGESITDTTYTMENLERGVNYFWQVRADDGINEAVESTIRSFTTASNATDNRYYFVKTINGNNVIFSGNDTEEEIDNPDENLIQITAESLNCFRPRQNSVNNRIAFLRTIGANTHLFAMDRDGSNMEQLTQNVPVAGFRQDEVDFTWYLNGNRIYYPHYNRIYSINFAGNGNSLVYEEPNGQFITEIASNEVNNLIAIKTNDASGYNARIVILNPNNGIEQHVVIEGLPGALGGIDFSADGTKVLYTRDVSGFENEQYRQLDSRVFIYDIPSETTIEVDTEKPIGFNDLDAKFAPNEGAAIFTSTSNDGISEKQIVQISFEQFSDREVLFTNSSMPDWE